MEISDIIPHDGAYQRIYCGNCGGHTELTFPDFDDVVSGISIFVHGLPTLRCPNCGTDNLPDLSRLAIVDLHRRTAEKSLTTVRVSRRKRPDHEAFTNVPFLYDPDDYWYIPGLHRPFDIGFLQPVFFKRPVLLKYDNAPGYRVQFASTTYGQIVTENDYISFGINRHGNVVMWLGDIAKLPENEQYYLRSENVPSDHSIGSEFYDGQIEVKFTDPSAENSLFKQRSEFVDACFARFGRKIAHLETEALDLALTFNPPVVDTPKERRHVADTLNKVYLESFDNDALLAVLTSLGLKAAGTGSLKRLQAILEAVAPSENIAAKLSPLYVLYDLRVAYSHLTSGSESSVPATVATRLGISADAELALVYTTLRDQMATTFVALTDILKAP